MLRTIVVFSVFLRFPQRDTTVWFHEGHGNQEVKLVDTQGGSGSNAVTGPERDAPPDTAATLAKTRFSFKTSIHRPSRAMTKSATACICTMETSSLSYVGKTPRLEDLVQPLLHFLQDSFVASLLSTHSNQVPSRDFVLPPAWKQHTWWDWAVSSQSGEHLWMSLVRRYTDLTCEHGKNEHTDVFSSHSTLPPDLAEFIHNASHLQLDRRPIHIPDLVPSNSEDRDLPISNRYGPCGPINFTIPDSRQMHGMSPKKAHEVSRMLHFIARLTSSEPRLRRIRHIVDIGAGQGYLSRALRDAGFHVLALDGDAVQTEGAERRETNKHRPKIDTNTSSSGSLSHKTTYITPSMLQEAVSSWTAELSPPQDDEPISVLFVALHACGSLTPDIFRAFASTRTSTPSPGSNSHRDWVSEGAVIVGCCYNLMNPEADFPLSEQFSSFPQLTPSHLQLAAQMPAHWFDSPSSTKSSQLAVRKVAYRALLEALAPASSSQSNESKQRLGRLPDSAYASFPEFVSRASAKMGVVFDSSVHRTDLPVPESQGAVPSSLLVTQRRVEILHVLRCIVGPCVESMILLDRLFWLRRILAAGDGAESDWKLDLVGLFDQGLGSARNFALVVVSTDSAEGLRELGVYGHTLNKFQVISPATIHGTRKDTIPIETKGVRRQHL